MFATLQGLVVVQHGDKPGRGAARVAVYSPAKGKFLFDGAKHISIRLDSAEPIDDFLAGGEACDDSCGMCVDAPSILPPQLRLPALLAFLRRMGVG